MLKSPVSATAAFSRLESDAGDPLSFQISIRSSAQLQSAPVVLSQIDVLFEGSKYHIRLNHKPDSKQDSRSSGAKAPELRHIDLREEISFAARTSHLEGWTDLTIFAAQEIVLESALIVREAGTMEMNKIVLQIDTYDFVLQYNTPLNASSSPACWWRPTSQGLKPKKLGQVGGGSFTSATILPRPPKMEIRVLDGDRQYYTDEVVTLEFEVANMEDAETESALDLRLMSGTGEVQTYTWASPASTEPSDNQSAPAALPGHNVGRLQPRATSLQAIKFAAPSLPVDLIMEAKVVYYLVSDRDTPASKTISYSFNVMSAFEANYEFTPRVHPDPWPTFFGVRSLDDGEETEDRRGQEPRGLQQRWRLIARMASFAEDGLVVDDVGVVLDSISGNAICQISKDLEQTDPIAVAPQELYERTFNLNVQKISLDDRLGTSLSMSLSIKWHRANAPDSDPITSTLLMPDMAIPNSEPRVLANAYPSSDLAIPSLVHVEFVLENPTMHFLTFDMTMEASEEFAFSGPKFGAANLLPLSRTTVRFNILPLVRGAWISPSLKVMDRYFGKQLKVLGTDGIRVDKKGISVWVDVDESG